MKRVKAPIETVLLDSIARGIADVKRLLAAQVPEGFKEEVTVEVEGTTPVPMVARLRKPPFMRASLFVDDGSDPVYVMQNEVKPEAFRDAPLKAGEKLDIDTTEHKIEALFFACEESDKRATVRVHLLK